ncbi:MAG TPA: response regulator [Thermodesulfovibrionales bacterium]|nr:response regulator [Thermodesulfovibrionales bacterium]
MKGRILVVEDDEANRKLFVSLLRERGYEVSEATDGRQALDEIERDAPPLILMDIVLPEMTGLEVVRACRTRGLLGRSKVYALTASEMPESDGSGFDGVIMKPVRVKEFLNIIEKVWNSE